MFIVINKSDLYCVGKFPTAEKVAIFMLGRRVGNYCVVKGWNTVVCFGEYDYDSMVLALKLA